MKRPYLMLYVADWQSNAKLRLCSHAERGIWLDVMCIMHDQDEYGVIRWPLRDLAQAVHTTLSSLKKLVDREILKGADAGSTCGAFIYTPRSGRKVGDPVTLIESQPGPIWYSSRMVRDEYVRNHSGLSTRFGSGSSDTMPRHGERQGDDHGAGKNSTPNPSPSRARASSSFSDSTSSSKSFSSKSNSTKEEKAERPAKKPQDERAKHPAIVAVRDVKGRFPHKDVWDLVIEKVGSHPDVPKMRECWLAWRARDYSPESLGWLVDWYINGIPGVRHGSNRESSSERNARNLRENVEYIRDLSRGSGASDREDPPGLLATGS